MTGLDGRLFHNLHRWVIAALFLALVAGILLPVYSDEVGWRLQERAWLDGVDKLYSENCGPNTLAAPPWFMMPVRWYSAFFNTHFASPLWVRVSGVLYALGFMGLVLRLIGRVGRAQEDRLAIGVIAASLMGLGVMPLLMVWSRPEQPIMLATVAALVIAANGWRSPGYHFAPFAEIPYRDAPTVPLTAWWRSLAIVALGVVALSYHFKAMLIVPVLIACIAFSAQGRRAIPARVVGCGLLVAACGVSAQYWLARMACPLDPMVAAAHGRENLVGQLAVGSAPVWATLEKIFNNYRLHKYVDLASPVVRPMSQWLVSGRVSDEEMHGWQGGMAAIWAIGLAVAAWACMAMGWRGWRARRVPPETVLALLLFGAASVWCVSQVVRHVYEASFVLPMVMLAVVLAISAPHGSGWLRQAVSVVALGIGPLMVLSILLVAGYYGEPMVAAAQERGNLTHQHWSVPLFGYDGERIAMMAVAQQCGLPPPEQAQGVMIDDATYFAYMQSRLPDHQLAILSPRLRGRITDPIAYLRERGSSGILIRCGDLTPELRAKSHGDGRYCCIGAGAWNR